MAKAPSPPDECANCGAAIPRNARACPECGADERTGWQETSALDGLDLPAAAYDDDPDPARRPASRRHSLKWHWLAIGLFLLIWLGLGLLAMR